jgi:hypothetical protein
MDLNRTRNVRAAYNTRLQYSKFLIFEKEEQYENDSKTHSLFPDVTFN